MIKLMTGNLNKYTGFEDKLENLGIEIKLTKESIPEIQATDFITCVSHKAREAARTHGEPVIVDDTGIIIDELDPFPGPQTKVLLSQIGCTGLELILTNVSLKARMVCCLCIHIQGESYTWFGETEGYLDFSKKIKNSKMPLSDIFIPNKKSEGVLQHRLNAFEKLSKDIFYIQVQTSLTSNDIANKEFCYYQTSYNCPFCIEFDDIEQSIFKQLLGDKLNNRVVFENDNFIVLVPIGQFIEGGLLLLSKEHIPSFAYLDKSKQKELSNLIEKIKLIIKRIWGLSPVVFEHGPPINKTKGRCCVDHAHMNIFPVDIDIHKTLKSRQHYFIKDISNLSDLSRFDSGYLYLDSPLSGQSVYNGEGVVSQEIRKIITKGLGFESRWHWRSYMGVEEMINTMKKLNGQFNEIN